MINAEDLVMLFRQAYDERWGYIWGGAGETWTQAKQDAATREQTKKYGQKWVGRKVADCSGLFAWAFRQLGARIAHGSNSIWREYLGRKGQLNADGTRDDGQPLLPGTAVFQTSPDPKQDDGENQSHIGLYIGDGKVIEAYGTAKGVILTDLVARQWEQWGELLAVDYTGGTPRAQIRLTLRKGAKGEQVTELQTLLMAHGYALPKHGADGDFGAETLTALEAFQAAAGLTVDGIAGPATWAALHATTDEIVSKPAPADPWDSMTADERIEELRKQIEALRKEVRGT